MIEPAARAASTVQGEAVSIGPAVEAGPVIWTARLRTGRVAIFRASVSRAFSLGALTEAAVDLAVIALAAGVMADLVGIVSVAAVDLAAAVSADLVVEGSAVFAAAAGDEN